MNLLLVDEFQDIAAGHLPVIQETLSHAANPRTILTGTPKLIDNPLEGCFNLSTANIWTIDCTQCGTGVTIDEHALGPTGLVTHLPIASGRRTRALGPARSAFRWGQGFSISHAMVPWHRGRYDQILERRKTMIRSDSATKCLRPRWAIVVSRSEVEQCCGEARMLRHGEQEGLGIACLFLRRSIGAAASTAGPSWSWPA